MPELVGDDAASAVSSIHSAQSSAARVLQPKVKGDMFNVYVPSDKTISQIGNDHNQNDIEYLHTFFAV